MSSSQAVVEDLSINYLTWQRPGNLITMWPTLWWFAANGRRLDPTTISQNGFEFGT